MGSTTPAAQEQDGLTFAEAARRLARDGPNQVPQQRRRSWPARVLGQLRDPMILLLLGALVVVVLLGDLSDAVIIAAVVLLNTTIGVVQEVRAENAIAALDRMSAPRARVRREGRVVDVDAAELVVDDLVRLEAGDVVPADLLMTEAVSLEVDEASMTGESVPVGRAVGEELLSGTVVTRGRGFGTVLRTGADSGLGRIAALIAGADLRPTPLQQRLSRLSRQLVVVTALLCCVVLALSVARGSSWTDALILAVSLGVAAIPESLPAVVSVALAMGAYRMARRAAVVRWLPAVETLGSVSVLASDKTGTLTEGRMTVQRLWTREGSCEVTGVGYGVHGEVVGDAASGRDIGRLLRDVALCNDAGLRQSDDAEWQVFGDPMEVALLVAATKHGITQGDLDARWPRVDETPFDSERQYMRTVHRGPSGGLAVVKGAPEVVFSLVPEDTSDARRAAELLAEDGFRVLAVADCRTTGEQDHDLELVGLVGIADPARPDAADVVGAFHEAGIRTVLVTGDHPATARAIAAQVGIAHPEGDVVDGDAVARGEHAARVESIEVYARIQPDQKVDIVDAWRARGHVVAMTGDGVNDGPALRHADIGVAMGDRGTEVARQAADLVLADDNLRTLVKAVAEGRRIHSNIRSFLRYGLAGGLAEVMVILVAPFFGILVPLLPAQILWINMLTHGLPGVAFGGEPLDPAVMRRPSPSPEQSVLGGGLLRQIAVSGMLISVVSLVAGLLARHYDWHVQSTIFLTLGLAQLGIALAIRAPRHGRALAHRALEGAVLLAAALQVAGIAWAPLRDLLGTHPLPFSAFAVAALLAAVPGLAALRRRT
ncbi:MAG: cation-translocating P-type ATPase [Nocardioides sp.]|jgi:P-type Ca2+ transporter type 2C